MILSGVSGSRILCVGAVVTDGHGRLLLIQRGHGRAGDVFDIRDYAATVTGGTLRPGDDAADARWVGPEEMAVLPVTEGLVNTLTEWGVLGEERSLLSCFSVPGLRVPFVPSGM
jgi:hypothetical protein